MKKKVVFLGIMLILLSGCRLQSNVQLTETAQVTQISGAKTLIASLSQTPEATMTFTVTPTSTTTETPLPTATVTSSPSPQPTSTSGAEETACYNARFVNDVSIPDGTEMNPGETFTKTWRIENTGSCEWTTDFSVSFLSGDKMEGEAYQVSEAVGPGQTHDISIEMQAPLEAGTYTGTWTIKNENGISFGQTFYVQIEVTSSATETFTPEPATETPEATSTTAPSETPES